MFSLARSNPFEALILDGIDRSYGGGIDRSPRMESWEDDDAHYLSMAIPGCDKDRISVVREGDVLTVGVDKEREESSKGRRSTWRASFSKSVRIPSGIEDGKEEAEYKDGVLTIRLPKAGSAKAKRIEVK